MSADPSIPSAPAYHDPETGRGLATSAETGTNRVWSQPLPGHARLGALVGPEPLHLAFDCTDDDFEFALTSSWPLTASTTSLSVTGKAHANSRQADLMKVAETLNSLVRLYAIETGNTNMHVLVEARRGVVGVPPWWDGSPCLFATFAFDTAYSEAGLFTDPVQAFAAMEMVMTPHRLLLAVGPARPDWSEGDEEEAWIDADSQRIAALKRVESQISKDIARLMANTHNELAQMMMDAETGGMHMEEALVEGLSRVRGAVQKMRGAILGYEHRRSKKHTVVKVNEPRVETPSPSKRMRTQNDVTAALVGRQTLASTVRELQVVLKKESTSPKVPLPARITFRRGLTALTTLEQSLKVRPVVAVLKDAAKPGVSSPVRSIINKISEAVAPAGKKKVLRRVSGRNRLLGLLEDLLEDYDAPEESVSARPAARHTVKGPSPGR